MDQSTEQTSTNTTKHVHLGQLASALTCYICKGYFVNATTLTECLHSFCKSCIVRYFQVSKQCPKCDILVHRTRPLLHARSDRQLQTLVYKLVPGLFQDEMKRRRRFYEQHPRPNLRSMSLLELEERGEVSDDSFIIFKENERFCLSLEYSMPTKKDEDSSQKKKRKDETEEKNVIEKRYLRCSAAMKIHHLKKFIRHKFELDMKYDVDLMFANADNHSLSAELTLMDTAYMNSWRRNGPLPIVFKVYERNEDPNTTKFLEDTAQRLQTSVQDSEQSNTKYQESNETSQAEQNDFSSQKEKESPSKIKKKIKRKRLIEYKKANEENKKVPRLKLNVKKGKCTPDETPQTDPEKPVTYSVKTSGNGLQISIQKQSNNHHIHLNGSVTVSLPRINLAAMNLDKEVDSGVEDESLQGNSEMPHLVPECLEDDIDNKDVCKTSKEDFINNNIGSDNVRKEQLNTL